MSLENDLTKAAMADSSIGEGFANHPHIVIPTTSGTDDFLGSLQMRATSLFADVKESVRANPWPHVAVAGAGALAIGYFLGRAFFGNDEKVADVDATPAGYDE